jgi:hypothetical protein
MSSTFGRLAHAMKIIICKDSITGKKKRKKKYFSSLKIIRSSKQLKICIALFYIAALI